MDMEDLNIINYFKDKKNGFYVDVGCFHPLDRNNTYLLYKKKWRGINIDVSKFSIDLFNFLRPEDINVNIAIYCNDYQFFEKIIKYFDERKDLSVGFFINNNCSIESNF